MVTVHRLIPPSPIDDLIVVARIGAISPSSALSFLAEVSLRSGGAISGSFTGSVTAFGLDGTTTGSIVRLPNGQGRVWATVRVDLDRDGTFDGVLFPPFIEQAAFSFVLGESLPPDNNRPVFGSIADIVVTVSTVDAEVIVEVPPRVCSCVAANPRASGM